MIKLCKYCNAEFETADPKRLYCDGPHYTKCPVCGKDVLKLDNDFSRKPACCSRECSSKLTLSKIHSKICVICGEEFKPSSGVATICNKEHHVPCEICGEDMIITKRMWHDNVTTCNKECRKKKTRRNNRIKYGTDHPMQNAQIHDKFEASMQSKYGTAHALQCDELKEKTIRTNQAKFGCDWAAGSQEFVEKRKQTMLNRYGAEHTFQIPELTNKISPTWFAKYGVEYPSKEPVQESIRQCLITKHDAKTNSARSSLGCNTSSSDKLVRLLMEADISYSLQCHVSDVSFDISLPESSTLIEVDPTYTHNAIGNRERQGLDKQYHVNKTILAKENGFRCIHVFDWDDTTKIIDLVKPKQPIYARKCSIYKLKRPVTRDFLNEFHLQGDVRGQLLCLGLVYEGQLIEVMTFGLSRYDKKYSVELLRLCTRSGYIVVGGAQRLFKFALENYRIDNIISYCDLSKFNGDVYSRLGMTKIRETEPHLIWSKGSRRVTSNLLRTRGYDQLFGTSYGTGTSNEELMIENGWLPIYDCGQAVFEYRLS